MAAEVETILKGIEEATSKVGNLLTEVAAASAEQAQGVEQINLAVGQMDVVTQSTAASAQETASASQELANQGNKMLGLVSGLKTSGRGAAGEGNGHVNGRLTQNSM